MEEQQLLDIAFFNKVMRKLSDHFELRYIPPLYNDDYIQFELLKPILNNPKPTIVTIKSNGRITFTVNRSVDIPNISATQSRYSSSTKYKGWTRISSGPKSIDSFFNEIGPNIANYL